jgi:hypothetical protein
MRNERPAAKSVQEAKGVVKQGGIRAGKKQRGREIRDASKHRSSAKTGHQSIIFTMNTYQVRRELSCIKGRACGMEVAEYYGITAPSAKDSDV